jgi:hypothetical protein
MRGFQSLVSFAIAIIFHGILIFSGTPLRDMPVTLFRKQYLMPVIWVQYLNTPLPAAISKPSNALAHAQEITRDLLQASLKKN